MNNELIISSHSNEVIIALLNEKRLIELHKEKSNSGFSVGDLYFGRVRKVIQGLNAAFVDIGYEKDAFLHYLDLGPNFKSLNKFIKSVTFNKNNSLSIENVVFDPEIPKTGKISHVLAQNNNIMVQVVKEPISTKGPRLTSEISLAGRFIVLIPFSDKISISQRIKNQDERIRLKKLIQSIKPNNFGVIVRTAAENKKVAELDMDLKDLVNKWNLAIKSISSATPPHRVFSELDRTSTILRDILNASFNSIQVDNQTMYDVVLKYIKTIAPEKRDIVKLYKGKEPIFEFFGVEKQIKNAFGRIVNLKGGAYIIIEHTEALHVVDVNSGHRINSEHNQEANALEVNLDAATEIARQLRLRDLGGIIVVDFIDLRSPTNKKLLYLRLRDEMKNDRAKHNILPPSKFGLVQITRQRVRTETSINTVEKCPACDGTGEIKASITFVDDIESDIKYIFDELNQKHLHLEVHPIIYAYLKKLQWNWYFKFKKWIKIKSSKSCHLLECRFFDKNDDEIKL
ncbi:MAG: Rne/Rng family ribonuclease [Bacteroidales bacterium]|nr:Rne/Rng family ribonuclease [Bacteroidales bacterium]